MLWHSPSGSGSLVLGKEHLSSHQQTNSHCLLPRLTVPLLRPLLFSSTLWTFSFQACTFEVRCIHHHQETNTCTFPPITKSPSSCTSTTDSYLSYPRYTAWGHTSRAVPADAHTLARPGGSTTYLDYTTLIALCGIFLYALLLLHSLSGGKLPFLEDDLQVYLSTYSVGTQLRSCQLQAGQPQAQLCNTATGTTSCQHRPGATIQHTPPGAPSLPTAIFCSAHLFSAGRQPGPRRLLSGSVRRGPRWVLSHRMEPFPSPRYCLRYRGVLDGFFPSCPGFMINASLTPPHFYMAA